MTEKISRRKLLEKGSQAIVAGGLGVYGLSVAPVEAADPDRKSPAVKGVDYYEKLGVETLINAAGTYTFLTASTMPPEVQAAAALAAQKPVNLMELHEATGKYLAEKLHCGGALVTSGAAAALTLGTAACITLEVTRAPPQCNFSARYLPVASWSSIRFTGFCAASAAAACTSGGIVDAVKNVYVPAALMSVSTPSFS